MAPAIRLNERQASVDSATFHALAEPARLRIVELLRAGPLSVGEIAERLGMRQPQASKHLRVLGKAGIVEMRADANRRICSLHPVPFQALHDWLLACRPGRVEHMDRLDSYIKQMNRNKEELNMTNHATNKMVSKVEGRVLILERVFDAPRALVFKAFSEAEHLMRWWSPKGWSMPVCNLDFRPGGPWHYCMKCTDESQEYYGQESWGKMVYHEIEEPERLVYTDWFSDPEGNQVEMEGLPSSHTTMTFIEMDGKTKIVSRTEYASPEAVKTVLDMGMLQGVTETWDKLAGLLEELQG